MFRPQLEALEARETPSAAHPDLYTNIWINSGELPAAGGGHTGNVIGIDYRPAAGDSKPTEVIGFVYHTIKFHADGNSPDKDEALTISQNRTEAAGVRYRTFAIVDRTQMAHDLVWLDLGTPVRNAGGAF